MIGKLFAIVIFCYLPLAGPLVAALGAAPQSLAPVNSQEQLLVYHNGNLQRGQITRELGRYVVLTPSGSRLVVPIEQVDFLCRSLDEALQIKRDRLPKLTADSPERPTERIELFHWCLKQGLYVAAEEELTQLQLSRLSAGELYSFLRQLHAAIARTEAARNRPAPEFSPTPSRPEQAILLSDLPPVSQPPLTIRLPGEAAQAPAPTQPAVQEFSELIRPVAFEEAIPAAEFGPLPVPELERLLKQLPAEGTAVFKRRVEPLLFRNCSNAGCHDPDKTRLPLLRLARGEGIPKRMSQQNLIQVLRFVGTGLEGNSPLLAAATTEHGGAIKPPLKKDSDHYRLLAAWAEHMALPTSAAGIEPLPSALFPPGGQPAEDRPPVDAQPLNSPLIPPPSTPSAGVAPPSASGRLPEIPSLETAPAAFLPVDPFDPEIFNRRMHSKPPAAGLAPTKPAAERPLERPLQPKSQDIP